MIFLCWQKVCGPASQNALQLLKQNCHTRFLNAYKYINVYLVCTTLYVLYRHGKDYGNNFANIIKKKGGG